MRNIYIKCLKNQYLYSLIGLINVYRNFINRIEFHYIYFKNFRIIELSHH